MTAYKYRIMHEPHHLPCGSIAYAVQNSTALVEKASTHGVKKAGLLVDAAHVLCARQLASSCRE